MSRIAIIGAGYTGLTAAYRLSQKGHQVTIFEKSHDLGGLASGFKIQGANLEKTYHHIFRTDTDIINLVKELGIEDKLRWNESSMSIYYNGKVYAFGTPISLLKFSPLNFLDRIRVGVVLLYLQKTTNWKKFIKIPAYDWLKKWSGKNAMQVIYEPLLKGKFDKYFDKVSMAWMWARVHIRANSQEKGGEKLGYFEGGFDVITQKLVEKLKENKVEIVVNANIEKIVAAVGARESQRTKSKEQRTVETHSMRLGGAQHVVPSPKIIVDGTEREFDKVIATVPSHVFARLIEAQEDQRTKSKEQRTVETHSMRLGNLKNCPGLFVRTQHVIPAIDEYIQKLKSVNYIGAICMVFSSDQSIGDYYWNNINDNSFPFVAFIKHTKLIDKSKYNNKHVYYLGTYASHDHKFFSMADEELYDLWFDWLKKIYPEFDENLLTDKFIFRLKNAQHIVDLDYENKIPDYKTPFEGIYLSNFSQIFPEDRGTNFAVREGERVSEEITKSKEQRAKNKEQRTKNREQRTENKEQRANNREQ